MRTETQVPLRNLLKLEPSFVTRANQKPSRAHEPAGRVTLKVTSSCTAVLTMYEEQYNGRTPPLCNY